MLKDEKWVLTTKDWMAATPNYKIYYANDINELAKKEPDLPISKAAEKAHISAAEKTQVAYISDPIFYRSLIRLLAAIVLVVVVGSIGLSFMGKSASDGVIAIGSGAVGALVGLFSNKN